jgi:hypothetical protein
MRWRRTWLARWLGLDTTLCAACGRRSPRLDWPVVLADGLWCPVCPRCGVRQHGELVPLGLTFTTEDAAIRWVVSEDPDAAFPDLVFPVFGPRSNLDEFEVHEP